MLVKNLKIITVLRHQKLIDILPEKEVENAVVYEISDFKSIVLINDNGKLISQSLPTEAQISPIKSSCSR